MRKTNPLPKQVISALAEAGPGGLRTATLLASLPDRVRGVEVTESRLRTVLHSLHVERRIQCKGMSRTMRGMPLRVVLAGKPPAPTPTTPEEVVEAFERRVERRKGRISLELPVLTALAELDGATVNDVAEHLGRSVGTVRPLLMDAATMHGTASRARVKNGQNGGHHVYSLTPAGERIVGTYAHTLDMAAR